MSLQSVREQFGANARFYVTHETHAQGASLARLVEVVPLDPAWHVLDVATGTGHTAFAMAPHVARVTATDMTAEMLDVTREQAAIRGFPNIDVEEAQAEVLDYPACHFDCVTCRIAPHHFQSIPAFLARAHHILAKDGWLVIIDNVVPSGLAGDYVNAFEKLRDPSHGACLSDRQWCTGLQEQGFVITHSEILAKRMHFEKWASRHDERMLRFLRALLLGAQGAARGFLQPRREGEALTFGLQEGFYVARKQG